jgi:ribosomal protein S18 acetylase RimI-like enzyme
MSVWVDKIFWIGRIFYAVERWAILNILIRDMESYDRDSIRQLLFQITIFSNEDQALALELVDAALNKPDQKDYRFLCAVGPAHQLLGYVCYGPTPLNEGSFNLYWIAVNPYKARKGVGTSLLRRVEETIRSAKGRLLVVETSSAPDYDLPRQFFLKNGYIPTETIPDLFHKGEERVTYIKTLGASDRRAFSPVQNLKNPVLFKQNSGW